jgi:hypothetical protein
MWHLTEREENHHDGLRERYRDAASTRSSINTNTTASFQHHPPASQPDLSPELSAAHVAQNNVHLQLTTRFDKTSTTHVSATSGHARCAQHHNRCQKTAQCVRAALSQNSNTSAVKVIGPSHPHFHNSQLAAPALSSKRSRAQQLSRATIQWRSRKKEGRKRSIR